MNPSNPVADRGPRTLRPGRRTADPGRMTRQKPAPFRWLYGIKRWMYRTGRPGRLAKAMNRMSALQFSAGLLSPSRAVTLEVTGRHTGRVISFPVAVADYDGERYLVSMLGDHTNWVRNVRAAGGRAALCRRGRQRPTTPAGTRPARPDPIDAVTTRCRGHRR